MTRKSSLRYPEWALAFVGLGALAAWLFLAFNSNGVQSGDSWIAYLPGALAIEHRDLALFRESLAFGYGRPMMPPFLVWLVHECVPQLSFPQASHLLTVLAAAVVGLLTFGLFTSRTTAAWAAAGVLLLFAAPAVAPLLLYTTPDMIFLAFCLVLAVGVCRQSSILVCLGFCLAAMTRSNAVSMAPALMGYYLLRVDLRRTQRFLGGGTIIAIAVAVRGLVGWGKPRASLLGSPASQWNPEIFLADAPGWSLEARLQFAAPEQYWLLFRRIVFGAPSDLFSHFGPEHWFGQVAFAGLLALACIGCVNLVARSWPRAEYRAEFVAIVGGGLLLYLPMALFHWETRYMLAIYALVLVAGLRELGGSVKAPWSRLAGGLGLVVFVTWTAPVLGKKYPMRPTMGLDDSSYRHDLAQTRAPSILAKVATAIPHRPIRIQGCETMPLPYLNYTRFRDFPDDFVCVGWRFHHDDPSDSIDAWIYTPEGNYTTKPENELIPRVEPIVVVGARTIGRITPP